MIRRRRQIELVVKLMGDLVATLLAFLIAYWLRFIVQIQPVTKGVPPLAQYVRLLPAILFLWPVVFYFQGLYQKRRIRSQTDESVRAIVAVAMATVLLTAGLTFYRGAEYSRLFLAIFAIVNALFVVVMRLGIRRSLGRIRRSGGNLQKLLVVGAGDLGRGVAERIQQHRELGFVVIGFLDDDPGKQQRKIHGVEVLGTTTELERIVDQHHVDQVVIALPLSAHQKTVQLIRRAGQLLLEVKVVPDLLQYYVLRAGVEDLDGLPVINLTQIPLQGWNQIAKRAVDITGALVLLLLTGWTFPIVAWFIKREDGGPVFYSQVRTGMDGRSFRLHKFRSMRVKASEESQWTRSNDPRITKVGAALRRFNLDELPQLINVLLGDMSLVGPRPEQPEYVERFRARYPEYNTRHRVRSGMTGWAQVNGLRGDTSIRQRMVHDLYYIQNWSLALDLRILWRTVRLALHDARA